jgi:hypothetical protein
MSGQGAVARSEIQADRSKIKARRSKIQAGGHKIQIQRNKIQMPVPSANRGFSIGYRLFQRSGAPLVLRRREAASKDACARNPRRPLDHPSRRAFDAPQDEVRDHAFDAPQDEAVACAEAISDSATIDPFSEE